MYLLMFPVLGVPSVLHIGTVTTVIFFHIIISSLLAFSVLSPSSYAFPVSRLEFTSESSL